VPQPVPEPVPQPEPVPEPQPVVASDFDFPTVYFSFNSITLSGQAKSQLRVLVRDLKDNPGVKLRIIGHTDTRGDEDFNEGLGQLRANAVLDYLTDQGINYQRFTAATSGEDQLVRSGSSESDHSANRRVSFQDR
jgi:OOP family OmpA-OmpF porin